MDPMCEPMTDKFANNWNPKSDLENRDQRIVYDDLRQRCPVAYSEELGWSIFRHDDVTQILNDHQSFSSAVSQHLSVPNGMDPPEHTAYRQMIEQYFLPDRIAAFEPTCRRIAEELIDSVLADEGHCEVEIMRELASQFAARSQCQSLGWPVALAAQLIQWVSKNQQAIRDSDRPAMSLLAREFEAIVDAQIDQRLAQQNAQENAAHNAEPNAEPSGTSTDFTASLMQEHVHGRKLSSEELSSILRNWTVGEIGTIAASIGILLHHIAQSDRLQQQLRSDSAQLTPASDEILRVQNPLVGNRRLTTCPVEIRGRRIDAGQRISLNWISANRDENVFEDADQICLDRDPSQNLLYGTGIHECPGAPLARMELRVFLESLFNRTAWIAPQDGESPVFAAYPASGFSRLVLRLTPNPATLS